MISNTCSCMNLYKDRQYDHPFIGSLFVNDRQYIEFCRKFEYYISQKPTFGEPTFGSDWAISNGGVWYKHPSIHPPYPVMYLDDIEIHWIHEKNIDTLLQKYYRRLKRLSHSPTFILSCSELLNKSDADSIDIIRKFIDLPNSIYISRNDLIQSENVIQYRQWNDTTDERDESHILIFNDQDLIADIIRQATHLNSSEL